MKLVELCIKSSMHLLDIKDRCKIIEYFIFNINYQDKKECSLLIQNIMESTCNICHAYVEWEGDLSIERGYCYSHMCELCEDPMVTKCNFSQANLCSSHVMYCSICNCSGKDDYIYKCNTCNNIFECENCLKFDDNHLIICHKCKNAY